MVLVGQSPGPTPRHSVGVEDLVGRDQRCPLHECLGRQEPVEWIAVVEREISDHPRVPVGDRQFLEFELVQKSRQFVGGLELPERALDGRLPYAHCAHEDNGPRVLQLRP